LLGQADAAIIRLYDEGLIDRLAQIGKPIVSLVHRRAAELGLPTLTTAGPAMAALAVTHLAEQMFHHVGYVGFGRVPWHANRAQAAEHAAQRAGRTFHRYLVSRRQPWSLDVLTQSAAFGEWLTSLPKPIGLLAADDRVGLQVAEACGKLGLRVPGEVAIIGGGNDAAICEAADPPLTSVDGGLADVGEQACGMLAEEIAGCCEDRHRHIPPRRVVKRASTDVLATSDPIVADALQLIRDEAANGLTAEALAARMPLSRSGFERRFRAAIHRSPRQELQRVRVEEAKRLLALTDLTLDAVASRSGFASPQRFFAGFKELVGVTPKQFRQSPGGRGDPRAAGS
jgi:LacI family transcriptional regulator